MNKEIMVFLKNEKSLVGINGGELVSYQVAGYEYMHQKGSPGWRNTDTEMFPIIGPTNDANYRVQTPKGDALQDQHGLLRALSYEIIEQTAKNAVFLKSYKAQTLVRNPKFPEKSAQQWLQWPYDFQFLKTFELGDHSLEITFTISGERDMAFMLGYHPAFRLQLSDPKIETEHQSISLSQVLSVGSRALHVPNCEQITLRDKNQLTLSTTGFGSFMLWTEVPNMVCIEPITFYPYDVHQSRLHNGFQFLGNAPSVFKVQISVKT
ncbi:aldose 1-epimerase [Arenibacter sp. GZD96]|uniref:aldose epimerase family protein n=1 Tax=Aurantibrevibacter litoralis TaxID=3106030 RepID=UPI002AFF85D7|nr:hypothetical protein [Arenibacter sp. GZD-96]MEA1785830.1 aldose 1-epimerase [Arenibacter sp. GZD-96]